MKKTLVLLSMATVVALLVASLNGAFGTTGTPSVYASRLAGIQGAGTSGISVQNLDASQPATIVAEFYNQKGGQAIPITSPGVGAGNATVMFLPSLSQLSNGAYAAIISADRQIAAIARTDWDTSGAAGIYSNVAPGTDVRLPLAVKQYYGSSSLVSIQNTDTSAQANVQVDLYKTGETAATLTKNYSIGPGTSITLDLAKDSDWASVPASFLGSIKVTSATEVGVQSFVNLENQAKAVYAFEGVPAEQAATTLYAPLVRNNHFGTTTGISVVNTENSPVNVDVTYTATGTDPKFNSCTVGQTFNESQQIAGGSSYVFYQGAATTKLPVGCVGTATIKSSGKILAIVNDANFTVGTSAAYNAISAAGGAKKVAMPLFRNGQTYRGAILTTGIQAMNISSSPANAEIKFSDNTGANIACGGGDCNKTIAAGAGYTWYPPAISGVGTRRNVYGAAFITSDQPLAVIVNDFAENGKVDAAIYNGIKADAQ